MVGAVALVTAFGIARSGVAPSPGVQCASAWRAANGSLTFTGERSAAEVALLRTSCERAGVAAMRRAYTSAVVGAIALAVAGGLLAVGAVARRRRPAGP